MITVEQYFRNPTTGQTKDHSPDQEDSARILLMREEALVDEAVAAGSFERKVDPDTGTEISGSRGGSGDGGFRLPASSTGAALSSHKQAKAVDRYDPGDLLDSWLDGFEDGSGGNPVLEKHGLYREDPAATSGWCHLTTRRPNSGRRTFPV